MEVLNRLKDMYQNKEKESYEITLDSLFVKSKDGFNEEPIERWNKLALDKITFDSQNYYLGKTKNIKLLVLLNDEDSLILSQTFPGGARVFNINKQLNLIIISENSILIENKESLLSNDFSDTAFIYYGRVK